jgi:hypothetical protein
MVKMKIKKHIIVTLIALALYSLTLEALPKRIANVYPLPKSYYNPKKLNTDLSNWSQNNPGLVKLHSLGKTANDKNTVYAMQIQNGIDRIPVLIVGQHHGDEVLGIEIAMSFADKLINSKGNTNIEQLLDKYSFWIIPTLNPDGWKVVTSGKYEWKRKNNTDTNKNRKFNPKTDGVDLNRNYPTFWHLDPVKPESNPYYKGIAPKSEAETKAITHLAELIKFRYAFFYHSSITGAYSEKIFLPWQDLTDKKTQTDYDAMRELAELYAGVTPRDYEEGHYKVHPGVTSKIGNSRNYFYYTHQTFALDIEVAGNSKQGIGIVHPNTEMKNKITSKNVKALIYTLSQLNNQ